MEWWMWLIIIYYSVPQVILSVKIFAEDDMIYGYHYLSPMYIHEEFDKLNWLGVILLWLLCFILFPGVYVAYFLEWLFTVGRRN